MELNDQKIRQLIGILKNGRDTADSALEELKRETGLYIYSFPAMAYRKNRDICSDFYLYLLERLGRVLVHWPDGAEIRFKTWFNYVLRNQFHNFSHHRRGESRPFASLDDESGGIPVWSPELEDDPGSGELEKGLGRIGERDRALIRLYYLPEKVTGDDIRQIVIQTGQTVEEVLRVVREMITLQSGELERKRETAGKIGGLNEKLNDLRYRLSGYRGRENDEGELARMNALMEKIARLEAGRSRLIRSLNAPDRKAAALYAGLFGNRGCAVRRLDLARNRLRFEMLRMRKTEEKAG